MRSTVTINLNKGNPRPIAQDFYRIRPLASYLWWLVTLYRKGARFDFSLRFRNTPPQRAWRAVRNAAIWLWERRDPRYTVVAYDVHRYCADMIEGGRWFNTYTLEEHRKCWRKASIQPLMDALEEEFAYTGRRYSVLGGEDCDVRYLDRFAPNPSYIDTYRPYE